MGTIGSADRLLLEVEASPGCPASRPLEVLLARGLRRRLLGLVGLPSLEPGTGLLLPRCRSIHTFGMRFPLDVAFLRWPPGAGGRTVVVAVHLAVGPGRLVGTRRRVATVEVASGEAERFRLVPGARSRLLPAR